MAFELVVTVADSAIGVRLLSEEPAWGQQAGALFRNVQDTRFATSNEVGMMSSVSCCSIFEE